MKVTEGDLKTAATLSRLAISKEEEAHSLEQLNKFLTYVENLSEADTEDVRPTLYALPMENVFREDVIRDSLPREAALLNAPVQEDGYFSVPRVLEE